MNLFEGRLTHPKEKHMKVSAADIDARITHCRFIQDELLTICIVTLDNGFKTVGTSACVDASEFDLGIGQSIARQKAIDALWPHFGFLLAEKMAKTRQEDAPKSYQEQAGLAFAQEKL